MEILKQWGGVAAIWVKNGSFDKILQEGEMSRAHVTGDSRTNSSEFEHEFSKGAFSLENAAARDSPNSIGVKN